MAAAKTWDVNRKGGGTFSFATDAQGNYQLHKEGFKELKTLTLPGFKKEPSTIALDSDKISDTKLASAQTKKAFAETAEDVQPDYFTYVDKPPMGKDETGIQPMARERLTESFAEDKPRLTYAQQYLKGKKDDTRPEMLGDYGFKKSDIPVKEPYLTKREDLHKYVDKPPLGKDLTKTIGAKKLPDDYITKETDWYKGIDKPLGKDTSKVDKKDIDRFPGMVGPQKPSPYQDAIMRGERGVKYEKPSPYQDAIMRGETGVKYEKPTLKATALKAVKTSSNVLSKAFNFGFKGPAMMLLDLVAGPPTATQTHAEGYFGARGGNRDPHRITTSQYTDSQGNTVTSSGNPGTDLYAGMNRVSRYGNLEKSGAKRIATREKTIAKYEGKWDKAKMDRFKDNTNNMRDQQNSYTRDKHNAVAKDAVANKGADPNNPSEMRAASIKASNERGNSGNGGKSGGKSIICTQMYQQTHLDDWKKTMQLWYIFQKKYLTIEHQRGYHFLFKPFVSGMKKSKILTAIGKHCAIARTNDIKHIMFGTSFSLLGRLVRLITEPICYITGKIKSWL